MSIYSKYIILIHGLWDTPKVFNRLRRELEKEGFIVLVPYMPHEFGRIPIESLAKNLDDFISYELGEEIIVNLLGFSMGGLIARTWVQRMNGSKRTNKFISVGSPHKGTFTAQIIPSLLFAGIAQMKRHSMFLKNLNENINSLKKMNCISFFCMLDLMVFPGWQAVLPVGPSFQLPVLTHKGLIHNPRAIQIIVREFVKTKTQVLNA
tara:strand:- start:5414 stop:6034 length:621 start_codon:yes stop_codon:yes gene_type:complete